MTLPPSSCDRLSLMFTAELKNLRETLRKFYELYIGFLVILSSNTLIFHYNQDQLCHELSSLPHVSVVWKDLSGQVAVFTCSSSKQLFKTQTCGKLIWERKKKHTQFHWNLFSSVPIYSGSGERAWNKNISYIPVL